MKKRLITGLLGGILALAFALSLQGGDTKQCGAAAVNAQTCMRYCKAMCDATVEVTNTDNGVVVKITATQPEEVKKIQECWATKAACKAARGTGIRKTPTMCSGKSKAGLCPAMKPE